jgi:hypothetical protein
MFQELAAELPSGWLKTYERMCEERLKQDELFCPLPVQLKRLQAEAAAPLGVTLPTGEPAKEEETSNK